MHVLRSENVNALKHKTRWIFFVLTAWLFGVLSPKALIRIYIPRSKIVNTSSAKQYSPFSQRGDPSAGIRSVLPMAISPPTKVSSLHYGSHFAPYISYFAPYTSYFAPYKRYFAPYRSYVAPYKSYFAPNRSYFAPWYNLSVYMLTRLHLPNWRERKSTAVFAGDTCLQGRSQDFSVGTHSLFVSLALISLFPPRHADVVDELVVFRARWSMADRF